MISALDMRAPRLSAFATALTNACTHDTAGAHGFAKAVGAIAKGRSAQSQKWSLIDLV